MSEVLFLECYHVDFVAALLVGSELSDDIGVEFVKERLGLGSGEESLGVI